MLRGLAQLALALHAEVDALKRIGSRERAAL
jgi:hypothetical protein